MPDDIDTHIATAEDELSQFEIHVKGIKDPNLKAECTKKIKKYRETLEAAKRAKLFGGSSEQDRELNDDERHQATMARLQQARQQLLESEEVGQTTLANLETQKETIKRTQSNVNKMNSQMGTADKLLTRMSKWWRG